MKPIVLVGHAHECPMHGKGTVVTGASAFSSNGRAVACVGDKTSCGATIVTGSSGFLIDGKPAATVGDMTDHGGTLTEGDSGFLLG